MQKKMIQMVSILSVLVMIFACGKIKEEAKKVGPLTEFLQEINASNVPKKMKAGETVLISANVKNISKENWTKESGVHLVYLWKDKADKAGNQIGGKFERTGYLKKNVAAGESVTLDLQISAPDRPGTYILILTMVQENIAFFHSKGAKALEIPVTVD